MEKVGTHKFYFPEYGDELSLVTDYYDNGDGVETGLYTNQKLTLQSHGNSASFELVGTPLTPEVLRLLANQLDQCRNKILATHRAQKPELHGR